MRLTTRARWKYRPDNATPSAIVAAREREEWIGAIRQRIALERCDFLELGSAPGTYSAALCGDTQWNCFGIDYSDDADLYLKAMQAVGKQATLYQLDFLNDVVDRSFDIVASFGLVEHFRGATLEHVFRLHDEYLRRGGYVVIQTPNFTGFQYVWHYVFDRPDLDNHNVDVMQPSAMSWFLDRGYEVVHNDYVGTMRLWGNSGWLKHWFTAKAAAASGRALSACARLLARVGLRLDGRTFAPAFLFIARKP